MREGQVKVQQLAAELELSNQKINRLNVEQSAHSSSVEQRLKTQISELESQLDSHSRKNLNLKQQADQVEIELQNTQQQLSASRIDTDRTRMAIKDKDLAVDSLKTELA